MKALLVFLALGGWVHADAVKLDIGGVLELAQGPSRIRLWRAAALAQGLDESTRMAVARTRDRFFKLVDESRKTEKLAPNFLRARAGVLQCQITRMALFAWALHQIPPSDPDYRSLQNAFRDAVTGWVREVESVLSYTNLPAERVFPALLENLKPALVFPELTDPLLAGVDRAHEHPRRTSHYVISSLALIAAVPPFAVIAQGFHEPLLGIGAGAFSETYLAWQFGLFDDLARFIRTLRTTRAIERACGEFLKQE